VDLAAKAVFGIFRRCHDPGFSGAQGSFDLGGIIADGRDNTDTSDNDATHGRIPFVKIR
jgi:hypothetical protein